MRRETGGAALVFGALSPRTRNAQVGALPGGRGRLPGGHRRHRHGPQPRHRPRGLHRAREVRRPGPARRCARRRWRRSPAAPGRHTRDGTFGATADLGAVRRPTLVEAVESHRFEPAATASSGATPDLSFASPARAPAQPRAAPARRRSSCACGDADDHRALAALAARSRGARRWPARRRRCACCGTSARCPDFRNVMTEAHTRLLAQIFGTCAARPDACPRTGWRRRSRPSTARTATSTRCSRASPHIRTWTYVSHRASLAGRSRALAGAHARGRGPPLRRAARAADRAVRGPPRGGRGAPRAGRAGPEVARRRRGARPGPARGPPGGLPLRARRERADRARAASSPPPTARCASDIPATACAASRRSRDDAFALGGAASLSGGGRRWPRAGRGR